MTFKIPQDKIDVEQIENELNDLIPPYKIVDVTTQEYTEATTIVYTLRDGS